MGAIIFLQDSSHGMSVSTLHCQRMTNAIRHFMLNLAYVVFNYIDDFMSIDTMDQVWRSLNVIGTLLRDLSIQEAEGKSVTPSHIVNFLGVLFDLLRMIILLPDEKVSELRKLLWAWTVCRVATQRQLQSIAGKLQFATTYIKQGRIFIEFMIKLAK